MTNFLKKENRIATDLSQRAKRERLIYYLIAGGLFILGSFLIFELLYEVCNIIGSIVSKTPSEAWVQLKRLLPIILLTMSVVYVNAYLRCAYKAKNERGRVKTFTINGFVCMGLGGAIALYVLIGVLARQYGSLVEGYPSPLFPLDVALGGLALVANGVLSCLYGKKLLKTSSELPFRIEGRKPWLRRVDNVFYTIAYLIVSFSFASLCYTPFVMDFTVGYYFFNVMMILVHLTSVLSFAFYLFAFHGLKEGLKPRAQREYSLVLLAVNALVWTLYVVALQITPEAPNLTAFGLLPIEYTASVNAFMYIYLFSNVVAPLSAFLKTLTKKKAE